MLLLFWHTLAFYTLGKSLSCLTLLPVLSLDHSSKPTFIGPADTEANKSTHSNA